MGECWKVMEQRFRPSKPVTVEAFKIHGISSEDLQLEPSFASWARRVGSVLRRADVVIMHMAL